MFPLRKLIAAAALAVVAGIAAPAQQAQAASVLGSNQTAVIGEDYTFNTTLATPASTPIGPVSYSFTFAPAAANAVLTAGFTYTPINFQFLPPGTFTGGFVTFSNGVNSVTQALVAGVQTTVAIPLSAAGPNATLTVGFDSQSGIGVLAGAVLVDEGAVSTIPLPASGLMLLAGLGAAGLIRRRAAKRAA